MSIPGVNGNTLGDNRKTRNVNAFSEYCEFTCSCQCSMYFFFQQYNFFKKTEVCIERGVALATPLKMTR